MSKYLLQIENLKRHFPIFGGLFLRRLRTLYALDGVTFGIKRGETVGVVGESGCGKSTLGKTLLRLYDPTAGRILFDGRDITKTPQKRLRHVRREMQIVFQDPFESLNSRHTVNEILAEPFIIHRIGDVRERGRRVKTLLDRVELPSGSGSKYPHEFSGGQRQRIGIARAIALNPKLIVCDEPVSALDVSIQSQILNLLLTLQERLKLAYLFIAHDLAVVKHVSDRVAVMYLGKIVELADAESIYRSPYHPYTHALISAVPVADPTKRRERIVLTGDVPSPVDPPTGCGFHTRCPVARAVCKENSPPLDPVEPKSSHLVACHFADRRFPDLKSENRKSAGH